MPSNDKSCAGNEPNDFRVRLKDPLNLGVGSYEVALVELLCRGIRSLPESEEACSVFSQDAKVITYYHEDFAGHLRANTRQNRKLWSCDDLEAGLFVSPADVAETVLATGKKKEFNWLLRNTGSRDIHLELPKAFLKAFSLDKWFVVENSASLSSASRSIDSLERVSKTASYTAMLSALHASDTITGGWERSDHSFHVILLTGQTLVFAGILEKLTTVLASDTEGTLFRNWQTNRSWQFIKRYLSAASTSSATERGNLYMYCYTDIIDYQVVGSSSVPLLRVVDLQRKGAEVSHEDSAMINPYYVRVNRQSIAEISIRLVDQRGVPIGFNADSHSVAVLHFRPRME